jgi:hypothetical protein
MKKYTVEQPMVTSNKRLLVNGDVIFVKEITPREGMGCQYHGFEVYCSETREYLGDLKSEKNLKLEKNYG